MQLRNEQGKISAITTPDNTVIGIYGKVDINTIGQYTGLKDKNGTKIFEGDIVCDEYSDRNGVIEYSEDDAQFQLIIYNELYNFSDNYGKDYEVIRKYIW